MGNTLQTLRHSIAQLEEQLAAERRRGEELERSLRELQGRISQLDRRTIHLIPCK